MEISLEVSPNLPWGRLEAAGPAWNSWGDRVAEEALEFLREFGFTPRRDR